MTTSLPYPRSAGGAGAALFLVLMTLAPAGSGCGGTHETDRPDPGAPLAVSRVLPAEASWPEVREATGTVEPMRRATPGTVLMGTVDAVLHREGDRVRSGETLARVESREAAARVAQAEAAVAAARAQADNARLMKERLERLHEREAATRKSLDDAVAALDTSLAQLRAAEEGVKAAAVWLDHARVTAPFDGIVSERLVEAGDTAAPGAPLFVVDDLSRVKVEVQVAESDLAGLGAGDAVEVEVPAAATGALEATVAEVLPAGDPGTRTFTMRILVGNADLALRPGMFARVTLPRGERPVLTVPAEAVVQRGPVTSVFVVGEDGRARLRWVSLGARRDGAVEVLTGLAAGEPVVSPVPPELVDGRPVEAR